MAKPGLKPWSFLQPAKPPSWSSSPATSKIVQFLSENEEDMIHLIEGALKIGSPNSFGDMALRDEYIVSYDGNYEALIAQIRNHSLYKLGGHDAIDCLES